MNPTETAEATQLIDNDQLKQLTQLTQSCTAKMFKWHNLAMKPLLIGNASIETTWQWSLTYLVDMKIALS